MSRPHSRSLVSLALLVLVGCGGAAENDEPDTPETNLGESVPLTDPEETTPEAKLAVTVQDFGTTGDDRVVKQYTLTNTGGMVVTIIDYGAIVTGVNVPDAKGEVANVTLTFDTLDEWLKNPPYFGGICGRYANRIAGGKFTLDEQEYDVTTNEGGKNLLHGGAKGFDKRLWTSEAIEGDDAVGVKLTYVSEDGEEGFPGTMTTVVKYTLDDDNALTIAYEATTDAPTVLNLTNHCYWNLGGAGSGDTLDQLVQLHCDRYLPVDENSIPTGELAPVADTPYDFTQPKPIGDAIEALGAKKTESGTGVDHCFVINGEAGEMRHVATVTDPESGRVMEIHSTEPGVQFYTGNYLSGEDDNAGYAKHDAFCLECNHYPDSPNHPDFPTTVLRPGATYTQTTVHRFSTKSE